MTAVPTLIITLEGGQCHCFTGSWADFNPDEWIELAKKHPGGLIGLKYSGTDRIRYFDIVDEIKAKHSEYPDILTICDADSKTVQSLKTGIADAEAIVFNKLTGPKRLAFLTSPTFSWTVTLMMMFVRQKK
jgi:hypothetical protein